MNNTNMMMEGTGITVLGFHLDIVMMIASGIFYIICAMSVWKSFRREKNELIGALFAFLVYQAISMFFMGVEMATMNIIYSNIAALSIFIGSAYMLKFPLSSFSEKTRRISFMAILFILAVVFVWFMQTEMRQMELMGIIIWYDLIVNGLIVGGSMITFGVKTVENIIRKKAIRGGLGVMSCCVVSNVAMITGAFFTSTIFAFLAPVIILSSLKSATEKIQETTI